MSKRELPERVKPDSGRPVAIFDSVIAWLRDCRCVNVIRVCPRLPGRQVEYAATFVAARALVVKDDTKTGKRDRQVSESHGRFRCTFPALGKPAMEFTDRVLKCIDCGAEFVFTAGEQLFFHDKQFKNDPKHCKQCKAKRVRGGPGCARRREPPARSAARRRRFRSSRRRAGRCCAGRASRKQGKPRLAPEPVRA